MGGRERGGESAVVRQGYPTPPQLTLSRVAEQELLYHCPGLSDFRIAVSVSAVLHRESNPLFIPRGAHIVEAVGRETGKRLALNHVRGGQ